MTKFFVKRLLFIIPVLIGVTILVFILLSLTPGDPALTALGAGATEEQIQLFKEQTGLDKPILVQYLNYMMGILKGDFGVSYTTRIPVTDMISARIWNTVILSIASILIIIILSIPIGVSMAVKQNSLYDNIMRVISVFFSAMPGFWMGIMLILLFSVQLGWLPSSGFKSFKYAILPIACLVVSKLTLASRTCRSATVDVIRQDYIKTARAKGTKESKIILKHALKNAMIPLSSIYGRIISSIFGSTVIIEVVFGINGIGRMMTEALSEKDIPTVMGSIIISAFMVALTNLAVDMFYALFDPRIKASYLSEQSKKKKTKRNKEVAIG